MFQGWMKIVLPKGFWNKKFNRISLRTNSRIPLSGSTGGQCAVTTLPSSSAAASSPGQLPQQLAQSQPPPKCIVIGQEGDRLLNLLQQRYFS